MITFRRGVVVLAVELCRKNFHSSKMDIASNLAVIKERIAAAAVKRPTEYQYFEPQLVAVSKLNPAEAVVAAYNAGQRHFGENYVNELAGKANDFVILDDCKDIKWHFIGHLQKSNVNKLLKVPNLYMIETIDCEKIATAVDAAWQKIRGTEEKLKVMIQVNTSGEEAKSGCEVKEASNMVRNVREKCSNLEVIGLMTIGQYGYDPNQGPNPDFLTLRECKAKVCEDLNLDPKSLALSMGMSTDFENAIDLGSNYVRVGTAIFGQRPPKT